MGGKNVWDIEIGRSWSPASYLWSLFTG